MRRFAWPLIAFALLAHPAPASAAPGTPETRYLEEEDDAKAEAMLPALLAKHTTPKQAEDLAKALRTRKARGDRKKDRDTIDWVCPDGKTRQLTYLLPSKHNPSKPAGVMVWLHGAIRQPAPGGGAGEAAMFRPVVDGLGFIVIGPSTYEGVEWANPACRALVHHALRVVKTSFLVDEDRVFVCGDSDGGRGTYATLETEATFVAAAVPVIGAPGPVTRYVNLRNVPWFAINGDKDSIFDIERVRAQVEEMKSAGIAMEWKVIPGGGHDPRFFLQFADEVRAFLGKHPRDPLPKKVEVCVDPSAGDGAVAFPANTFRWLRIEEAGASERGSSLAEAGAVRGGLPRAEATREGNRIDVKTSGVKRVTVLLSDAMIDFGKDVEVVVNEVTLHRGRVDRDARVVLEEGRRFLDRRLVFAARLTLDVDAASVGDAPKPPDAPPTGK